ncbi:aromatic amino acid ammonia-lyase [Mesorhizobium sp. YC-39]|uniref:aromatic amino acid ammonia-lyase n=1 Tax=unclassified Mesorhizobium TaxID=325217 RepID=UPI0021E9421B|nr:MULTISPECIES: aromatic amino acid ammonia-lyase [unclassified Mesorhizobium]MCV3208059.1 aromatic amino acid ammonia-lyase [Mesorhizobium sp. YC-2]MCV3229786.1 aromatic amino acid ammonia-lyase [Mesorhizobium sp. YC-39]
MLDRIAAYKPKIFLCALTMTWAFVAAPALAFEATTTYQPIFEAAASKTITLTGHDLTIDQVIDIARSGAKVELSPEALQRSADAYGLLLEGAAEGVTIYWFNRGAGDQRETVIFSGDPTTPENTKLLKDQQLARFKGGVTRGYGPELQEEALVRAIMAIRANTMSYEAASPQLTHMLVDMLNKRVTPVVQSRGTLGEGDLATLGNIGAAMVGEGDAYLNGVRMPAAQALAQAGLKPLEPFAADQAALISTNAYAQAQAVLLVEDARKLLEWTDLSYAMGLNGMNSSVTPISVPVQAMRPYPWLTWDAARIMDMIKGSYLFDEDPARIIQDPESMRASSQRQGSAWQAWADLRDSVLLSINSSDHNPAVLPGLTPQSSPELSTPQFMQYYIKGGKLSNGKSGYIFSNANWDPYPLANQVEAFTLSLTNLGVAVAQRIERFRNPFFTVIKPADVLSADQRKDIPSFDGYLPTDLWQELADLGTPVTPNGQAIVATVEDLEAQTRIKTQRAREAVDVSFHLVAQDLLTASYWMEIRKAQKPERKFGEAPTAALAALRQVIPWQQSASARPKRPLGMVAYDFMQQNPATRFYPGGPLAPRSPTAPTAGVLPN